MNMKKALAILLSSVLALALLVYSAMRSLDFISATLPADKQILAYFALAATEGGLLLWLAYFLFGAAGVWQRSVALIMVVVDLLGSMALFTADTLYRSGEMGLTATMDAETIKSIILAMSGVIGLNVTATVICHLTDPDARRRRAGEEAIDTVEEMALQKLTEQAPSLAAQLAPILDQDYLSPTRARYLALLDKGGGIIDGKLSDPAERAPAQPQEAQPSERRRNPFTGWARPPAARATGNGNGKATYNATAPAAAELAGSPKEAPADGRQ